VPFGIEFLKIQPSGTLSPRASWKQAKTLRNSLPELGNFELWHGKREVQRTDDQQRKKQAAERSSSAGGEATGGLLNYFQKSTRKASDRVRDDLRCACHENPYTINRDYLPAAPQFRSLGQFTPFRFVSRQESEREDGSLGFLPMQIKTVSDRERRVFQGPKTETRDLSRFQSQTKIIEKRSQHLRPGSKFSAARG
jgi:hypothetical protein